MQLSGVVYFDQTKQNYRYHEKCKLTIAFVTSGAGGLCLFRVHDGFLGGNVCGLNRHQAQVDRFLAGAKRGK